MRRFQLCAVSVVLAVLLASCGGHPRSALTGASTVPADSGKTTAALTITIPKGGAAAAARRSPRFVSPATQSITVAVSRHSDSSPVLNATAGLTPTSTGCTSTLATTICTLNLPLGPGTYDMTVATYDGYDAAHNAATGQMLSAGQTIGFTIAAGQANTVSVTLSGIPASLAVFSLAPGVSGTQAGGFTQYDGSAKFTVTALDPDGNIIVGPGAPAFTIALSAGGGFTVANPTAAAPNTFALSPTAYTTQTATFTATAAYGDATCATSGAVCTASFAVTSAFQRLFVSNYGGNSVTAYDAPYSTPAVTITSSLTAPTGITTDAAGDLFVGTNNDADVHVFAPPYSGTPTLAGPNGVYTVSAVLVAPNGTLFADGGPNLIEVAPPYTGSAAFVTTSGSAGKAMSMDSAGDLFVPNQNNNTVTVFPPPFAPPYTGTPTVITSGVGQPQQTLIDAAGNLFVANVYPASVTKYAPPYTGAAVTISTGLSNPEGIAMDAAGNLFVADFNDVAVFAKPYTGSPALITSGISGAVAVVTDRRGNLFVANTANSKVTEYAPPFSGSSAPIATISTGVNGPQQFSLALYPH